MAASFSSSSAAASKAKAVGLSLSGQVFFGSLCAGTFALGCWQIQRYFEKIQLVEQRTVELAMEPADYKTAATVAGILSEKGCWRRWKVLGRYDHTKEFLVGPRGPPPGALPEGPGTSAAGMSAAPQGYFVVTPLHIQVEGASQTSREGGMFSRILGGSSSAPPAESSTPVTVLVNRGWVPRHLVVSSDSRRGGRPRRGMQKESNNSMLLQWDRPTQLVDLTVISSQPEQPKSMIVAQHDLEQTPPRLFWFDRLAMYACAGVNPFQPTQQNDAEGKAKQQQHVALVTAVRDGNDDDKTNNNGWPVMPVSQKVGDFRVTPAVHAGYAATWYGLSIAGMYMTRILVTRGRGA